MQLKRFLSFCVAVLMIAATAVLPLSAVEEEINEIFEVGVEVGSDTPISSNPLIFKSGDEVSVRIYATQNTGVNFVSFNLYYNTEAFELKDVKDYNLFTTKNAISTQDGHIKCFFRTDEVVTTTGLIYEAKFTTIEKFDGKAVFDITIKTEKNCSRPSSTGSIFPDYVPFSGGSVTAEIHHIADEGVVTAPTCTTDGFTTYACTMCDIPVKGNIIVAPGHALIDNPAKAPDCTNIGWDTYKTCENCDYTTYVELPAAGHKLVDHEAKAATCTEIGWDAYQTCENCDYTTYMEIPAAGHKLVDHEAKAATCTEIGWDAYQTCENCDYTTYVEIPATGAHTGGTATCNAKALCEVCGGEYGEFDADNHVGETEIRDAVEAAIGVDGYTGDTYCKDCNAKLADGEVIPKLCIPGDANSDGKVNLSDVALILKHIAKWEVEIDTDAADVNSDDKINLSDVSLVLKYIANWEVTLG